MRRQARVEKPVGGEVPDGVTFQAARIGVVALFFQGMKCVRVFGAGPRLVRLRVTVLAAPGADVSVDLSGHGVVNADWHTSRPTLIEDMANRRIERPVGMGWGTAERQGQIRRADIDPIDPW